MRAFIKQVLDNEISRRNFIKKSSAIGVSSASAESFFEAVSRSNASERTASVIPGEVTGNGSDLLMGFLLEADVKYIFHG